MKIKEITVGTLVKDESMRAGIVTEKTAKTLTVKFQFSTAKYIDWKSDSDISDLKLEVIQQNEKQNNNSDRGTRYFDGKL